ncbi:MAG: hypothetical protein SGPRY_007521, partial [Prymnesium sp.]
ASLISNDVKEEACNKREATVRETTDISKFTVVTLKAVLLHRGVQTDESKAILVQRVHDVLLSQCVCEFWHLMDIRVPNEAGLSS